MTASDKGLDEKMSRNTHPLSVPRQRADRGPGYPRCRVLRRRHPDTDQEKEDFGSFFFHLFFLFLLDEQDEAEDMRALIQLTC